MPIDRLLAEGSLQPSAWGYEIRLRRDELLWELANDFAEEEAACCPALSLTVEEQGEEIVVEASFR